MTDAAAADLPRAYIASPLGFSEPTRAFYADVLVPAVAAVGVTPLDPWDLPFDDLEVALTEPGAARRLKLLAAANQRIAARNAELIRSADAVLAVLDGPDVDSGTAAEIGYAAALGIPIVGWRSDLRTSGDNAAATVNLQVEYFVRSRAHGLPPAPPVLADVGAAAAELATAARAHRSASPPPAQL